MKVTNQDTNTDERDAPRYELVSVDSLQVTVEVHQGLHPVQGVILDLSKGGAKIAVPANLAIDSEIVVTLTSGTDTIKKRSRICWSRPTRDEWWIGVAFQDELAEDEFHGLAAGGFVERRRDPRYSHAASMTARSELGSQPVPVELMDLSSGGFKMTSSSPLDVGKRVLIETDGHPGTPIVAKVRWQQPSHEGFLIGCAFVDKNGCGNLMRLLGIQRPAAAIPDTIPRHAPRRLLSLALGVALTGLIGQLLTSEHALATLRGLFARVNETWPL